MPDIDIRQFADALIELSLVSRNQIDGLLAQTGSDPRKMAQLLIASNHITAFQAAAVLHGRATALRMGEYIILNRIGQGGMGSVYRAQHRMMKRIVALKVISKSQMTGSDTEAKSLKQRFYREVQAAAKAQHPNIVAAYDAGKIGRTPYLVMEYVHGLDLNKLIKDHGPLQWRKAVDLILQAAAGLKYAHDIGMVHRDVKPANLLLTPEGVVKILDMGLARITSELEQETQAELTTTGVMMGTAAYMSPEQARDAKTSDHRADIYALGGTLFYLVTGKLPYTGETAIDMLMAKSAKPPPRLNEYVRDIPVSLQDVFGGMIEKDVADRYQSMADVIHDLQSVLAGVAISRGATADALLADKLRHQLAKQIEAETTVDGEFARLNCLPDGTSPTNAKPPTPLHRNHVDQTSASLGTIQKVLIGATAVCAVAIFGFMMFSQQTAPVAGTRLPEAPEATVDGTTVASAPMASLIPAPPSTPIPAPSLEAIAVAHKGATQTSSPASPTPITPSTMPRPAPTAPIGLSTADIAAVRRFFPIGEGEQILVADDFEGELGPLWNHDRKVDHMLLRAGKLVPPDDHNGQGFHAWRRLEAAPDLKDGSLHVYVRCRLPTYPRSEAMNISVTLHGAAIHSTFAISSWVRASLSIQDISANRKQYSSFDLNVGRSNVGGGKLLTGTGTNWTSLQFVSKQKGDNGLILRMFCLDESALKWLLVYESDSGRVGHPQTGPFVAFSAPRGPITDVSVSTNPIDAQGTMEIEAFAVTQQLTHQATSPRP